MTESTSLGEIEEGLMDALATMGPERDEITRDATFEQLDIDSLDLVELLQIAEEKYGVQLNPEDAKDVKTVGGAIDLVIERARAATA
jgi:acyl carrier protein